MVKCVVCERHPSREGSLCANCASKIEAERRHRKREEAFRYVTYRGYVVGFYHNGNGKLTPKLLQRNPERLPKCRTIDLNHYYEGFTREMVKQLKAAVLSLANA